MDSDKKLSDNAVKQKQQEFSYLAEFEKSVTALEIEYGALAEKGLIDHCLFYFRKPLPVEKLSQEQRNIYGSEGEEANNRLDALKSKIINSGGNIKYYTANWDEKKNCVTDLDELKELIISDLKELIKRELGEKKPLPWQKKEIKGLNTSFSKKCSIVSQLERNYAMKLQRIFSGATNLILIKGKYGFGKSTIMAKLAANAHEGKAHVLPIACGRNKNTLNHFDVWRQIVFLS